MELLGQSGVSFSRPIDYGDYFTKLLSCDGLYFMHKTYDEVTFSSFVKINLGSFFLIWLIFLISKHHKISSKLNVSTWGQGYD